jgi:hypothetical protein
MDETWIVPPNHITALCGVKYARLMARDRVRLVYVDNSIEDAIIPMSQRGNWQDNFLSIVSEVKNSHT